MSIGRYHKTHAISRTTALRVDGTGLGKSIFHDKKPVSPEQLPRQNASPATTSGAHASRDTLRRFKTSLVDEIEEMNTIMAF